MMSELILLIKNKPTETIPLIIGFLGLFAGGLWTILVFLSNLVTEREQRQFERYRLLIQNLNVGDDGASPYIDFQMDAVYQMRFFRKYYPRSLWMLNRLVARWKEADRGRSNPKYDKGHIQEIEETIIYIARRKTRVGSMIFYFIDFIPIFQRKASALSKAGIVKTP